MGKVWRTTVFTALTALLLAGCVSTQTGSFGEKKDPEKALQYSVEAARNYIQEGNWEAAKRHLRNALEINDRDASVHDAMALVFWRTGELELADQHFRRAVALDAKNARYRNNYAAFLYDQKRFAEAEQQLERVVEDLLYDRRADAFASLGRVRIKLQKYPAAKEALERALLMDRNNPVTVFALAEVYYQLGDYPKSQDYYAAYRARAGAQSAESLWLGVRLADSVGDRDAQASYALALKNLYPRSEEYLQYKSVYGHGGSKQ